MYDFYSFTTTQTGTLILDIDYTQNYANGFDPYLNVYDANQVQISSNDDGCTLAGAGGSNHAYDIFIHLNDLAAGDYFVRVGRCCVGTLPSDTSRYTLRVQALADVAPVPEPEIYAMLLAGLGLVGGVARRKQTEKRAA